MNRNAADGIILENGTKIENRLEYLRRDENNGDIHGDNIIVSNSCTVVCFCTIENVERTPRIIYKGRSYRQKLCSSGFVVKLFHKDCSVQTLYERGRGYISKEIQRRRFRDTHEVKNVNKFCDESKERGKGKEKLRSRVQRLRSTCFDVITQFRVSRARIEEGEKKRKR